MSNTGIIICSELFDPDTMITEDLGAVRKAAGGVKEDSIDAATGDSIRLSVDLLGGKAKNIVARKGE